jgi:hypothetical protein
MAVSPFAVNTEYEAKATGYVGTATAGTTSNVDFAVGAEDRYIDGVRIILINHDAGDTMDFQVIDIDNVLGYGANTVLKQFGTSWNVDHEKCDQGANVYNFLARLYAGLYIRIVYHSVGATNVTVKLNLRLFKKIA